MEYKKLMESMSLLICEIERLRQTRRISNKRLCKLMEGISGILKVITTIKG